MDKEVSENSNSQYVTFLANLDQIDRLAPKSVQNRLIRRCRFKCRQKNMKTIKNANRKKKNLFKSTLDQKIQLKAVIRKKGVYHFQEQFTKNVQSAKKNERKLKQKIKFDYRILSENLQSLYQNKKKLKNTDLMLPGIKYTANANLESISNCKKSLIVYQVPCKGTEKYHFGLLLKYNQRIITFDGLPAFWPIDEVQKSYHWENQQDTWSCGYRVLFWAHKIQEQGIEKWIQEFQNIEYYS